MRTWITVKLDPVCWTTRGRVVPNTVYKLLEQQTNSSDTWGEIMGAVRQTGQDLPRWSRLCEVCNRWRWEEVAECSSIGLRLTRYTKYQSGRKHELTNDMMKRASALNLNQMIFYVRSIGAIAMGGLTDRLPADLSGRPNSGLREQELTEGRLRYEGHAVSPRTVFWPDWPSFITDNKKGALVFFC